MDTANRLKRLPELESLRGLMALWVLVGHVLLTFDGQSFAWRLLTQNGRAVDIFMTLSGFVIFFLLDQQKVSYRYYIWPRFLRLYPAFIVTFAIAALLTPASMAALTDLPEGTLRNAGRLRIFQGSLDQAAPHIIAHLTMLHGLVPGRMLPFTDYAFLGQAWSISMEWQFYLIAPLFFFLTRRLLGLIAACALAALMFKARIWFGEAYIGSHVAWFALGIASFHIWRAQASIPDAIKPHIGWAVPAIAGLWVVAVPSFWQAGIWILVFGACLGHAGCVRPPAVTRFLRGFLMAQPLIWLGRISYSVYLTHMIAMFLVLTALERWAPSFTIVSVVLPLTLATTLAVSTVMYQTIERPFIEIGRGAERSRPIKADTFRQPS